MYVIYFFLLFQALYKKKILRKFGFINYVMSIKNVGSKQFWSPLGPKRILSLKQIKVKNNWDPKNLGLKKY